MTESVYLIGNCHYVCCWPGSSSAPFSWKGCVDWISTSPKRLLIRVCCFIFVLRQHFKTGGFVGKSGLLYRPLSLRCAHYAARPRSDFRGRVGRNRLFRPTRLAETARRQRKKTITGPFHFWFDICVTFPLLETVFLLHRVRCLPLCQWIAFFSFLEPRDYN